CEHVLLLVATRELGYQLLGRCSSDPELPNQSRDGQGNGARAQKPPPAEAPEDRQRDVVLQVRFEVEAVAPSVFGYEGNTRGNGPRRRESWLCASMNPDLSVCDSRAAIQDLCELMLAGTDQPAQT